jgi:hypothetical protein
MVTIADGRHAPLRSEPAQLRVGLSALWFGLFGAPAAWALQLIASYALVAHFCYPHTTPLSTPAFDGTRPVAIVVSVVLVAVAALALFVAVRAVRSTDDVKKPEEVGTGRTRFMARAGVFVSGIFVYGTLMATLPLFSMQLCSLPS